MADATIVFNQTYLNQQIRNVTVWNNFRDPEPDLQELADALRGGYTAGAQAQLSLQWSLDSITFVFNDTAPVWSLEVPFTAGPLVGTNNGGDLMTQAALLVRTVHVGPPPNRGRVYFGGIPATALDNAGQWTAAVASTFEDMVQVWANGITTDSNQFFLRIASRDAAGIITASSAVTIAEGIENPATQRRRRIGSGA